MARRKPGVSPSELRRCSDHDCFISLGPEVLKSATNTEGNPYEIYKYPRERGSTLRSFTHTVMSVGTLGIWNIVGVPMEGFVSSKEHVVVRVTYDTSENAEKIEVQG